MIWKDSGRGFKNWGASIGATNREVVGGGRNGEH